MNSTLKKILLLIVVIASSYFLAFEIGSWYNTINPQNGSAFWGLSRQEAISFAGFMISYIFLIPFSYGLFGITQNKKLIFWLLLPAVLLVLGADKAHFYIPLGLVLAGLAISWVLRQVWLKSRSQS